jgi:hypothetical protein
MALPPLSTWIAAWTFPSAHKRADHSLNIAMRAFSDFLAFMEDWSTLFMTSAERITRAKEIDPGDALRTKQVAFLTAVAELGTITRAALVAGVHRSMHYDWLADEAYTKAFNDAEEMFRDSVRTEVHRRAVEGWLEPVVYQGRTLQVVTGVPQPERM